MEIKALKNSSTLASNKKLQKTYSQFDQLLKELRTKELPEQVIEIINAGIDQVHQAMENEKVLQKQIKQTQTIILKLLEKELKLVTKNHYRNVWLAVGMAAFGIPMGVAFGLSFGNMAFIGTGMPIGLAIGIAIGTGMDKKAFDEGRQLDMDIIG
ncbi:hypothetical protein [Marinoscillum furvescens]|uniref:Uncharacterized protein n=1 Tax=Marinoscillum furvescens DSM 4134 TaxID=1122208 RepID=A0A3D9L3Y8_MARFU|nr:hypothetical protein [Marinoscillum furvescens]REE00128.1 hypothetical protein C7460_10665 [Marinoscillum furvescens DSM 4134]